MIGLSFSRWSDSECPFRFNALYIAKTYSEPQTDAMLIGGTVADILKEYRLHCFKRGVRSDLEWFSDLELDESLSDEARARILELLDAFQRSEFATIPTEADWWSVEQRVAFDKKLNPIGGDPEEAWFGRAGAVAFRMMADFAYIQGDTLYVIDDKTGRGRPDPLQVALYAYLAPKAVDDRKLARRVKRVVCIFNELGKGRKEIVGEYDFADDSWQKEIHEKILAKVEEVNSWTEFPARPCAKCAWCSVPGCPAREDTEKAVVAALPPEVKALPTEITTQEQAERAVAIIGFVEDALKTMKDSLRAWVEQHGPVASAGKRAELKPWSTWKPSNTEAVLKALLAYGAPRDVVFQEISLTQTALKKICKRAGILDKLPLIETMGVTKEQKPRFQIVKDEPDY